VVFLTATCLYLTPPYSLTQAAQTEVNREVSLDYAQEEAVLVGTLSVCDSLSIIIERKCQPKQSLVH
jgi:hypothetical protein